jgi:hypothetical protein
VYTTVIACLGNALASGVPIATVAPEVSASMMPSIRRRKLALAMRQPDPAVRKPPSAAID